MPVSDDSPAPESRPAALFISVVDGISNIWFGVGLLIAIFLYSSVGSAAPPIRQGALADWLGVELLRFEKSEMEWFNWWPFQVMIALFCVSLVLATVRRIPLTVASAGVWTIHLGILVLVISAGVYFGRKVEGDTVVFHSRALILAPGMGEPASMVIRPHASTEVIAAGKTYHVRVARIDPDYEILTGEHKREHTTSIWLNVQSSDPPREFVRVLIVGHRQYTQDVIHGPEGLQWASDVFAGKRLVDGELQIELDYDDPVRYYYHAHQPPVRNTGAIYARFSPDDEWTQIRFRGLPHYSEWISSLEELWPARGEPFPPLRPLNLEGSKPPGAKGFERIDFRVTDYLPYAELRTGKVAGGMETPGEAALDIRPAIVPRRQRQPLQQVGKVMSLVRVEIEDPGGVHGVWLPFHQYVFKDEQRAYPSRFAYGPRQVDLSDGRVLELMYSRWRDPLPSPIVLDRFILQTYPGGDRPSDYISLVRFREEGGWSDLVEVKSNHPARHGHLWYYQAQWDPGTRVYTVLGVGNREAVCPMLIGVCISIAGMIYAFYVKPGLVRRRRSAISPADGPTEGSVSPGVGGFPRVSGTGEVPRA